MTKKEPWNTSDFREELAWMMEYKPEEDPRRTTYVNVKDPGRAMSLFKYLPLGRVKHLTGRGRRYLGMGGISLIHDARYNKFHNFGVQLGADLPGHVVKFWAEDFTAWLRKETGNPVFVTLEHELEEEYVFVVTLSYQLGGKSQLHEVEFRIFSDMPISPGYADEVEELCAANQWHVGSEPNKDLGETLDTGRLRSVGEMR